MHRLFALFLPRMRDRARWPDDVCRLCRSCGTVSEAAKFNGGLWGLAAAAGFLLAWMFFYYLGGLLARIPSDFFDKS